jgi:hypothetical protein
MNQQMNGGGGNLPLRHIMNRYAAIRTIRKSGRENLWRRRGHEEILRKYLACAALYVRERERENKSKMPVAKVFSSYARN